MNAAGIYIDGERPPTKSSVRRALREDLASVLIEDTDSLGLAPERTAMDVQEGEQIEVCGPDPYADRRWTATITRAHGKVVLR